MPELKLSYDLKGRGTKGDVTRQVTIKLKHDSHRMHIPLGLPSRGDDFAGVLREKALSKTPHDALTQ